MRQELQAEETLRGPARSPRRLLMVDDNVEDLMYYTSILQRLGHDVRPCASFTEAANLFAREDFDLVIVSEGGTSFEGRSVLARAVEADRSTPVLVLTRTPNMDCYIRAMEMGAFDYLEKPLIPSEFAQLVSHHLRLTMPTRGMARHRAAVGEVPEPFVH
jgi:DNA-binding response OmpR family regulator